MMYLRLLATACFSVASCIEPLVPRVTIASRRGPETHLGWTRSTEPAPGHNQVRFTVFLKQRNLDVLESRFHAVSNPKSVDYGKFLTLAEVAALVAPEDDVFRVVVEWLVAHGIKESDIESRMDSIVVNTNANAASSLLSTSFHTYTQTQTGETRTITYGDASLPAEISEHVHFIAGLSELWHGRDRGSPSKAASGPSQRDADDLKVTPQLLRKYYNVPDSEANEASTNFQAVAAFNDFYSAEGLAKFYKEIDGGLGDTPDITIVGPDCLKHYDKKACDEVESDLDVQYMTAMAGRGSVKTMFHNANTSDGWVLGFSENALQLSPMPLVFSISYGWSELGQCDIAVMACFRLGYKALDYVERTNTNFQKLGVQGVSIFVSDGDDGAQGVQPSGWDPIDLDHWCGDSKWDCYPKTSSKCAEIVLHDTSNGNRCPWPVGMQSEACTWVYLTDFYQDADIEKAMKSANPDCDLQFFIDGSYNTHMYSSCTCGNINPLSHGSIVSESMPSKLNTSARLFYPDFPTSSPYVTSVGATAFKTVDGETVSAEHAASIKDGAIITTGGGFSLVSKMPEWQHSAVQAYVTGSTEKPPVETYHGAGRAYPDITLNGHNYQVAYNDADSNTVKIGGVDGTSASSPAVAGLISLINGARLSQGKPALGFLNPLLYAAYADDVTIFKDLTVGDNKCTRDYCSQYGFTAGAGWDPVGGLGSFDYQKLKAYALGKSLSSLPSEVVV